MAVRLLEPDRERLEPGVASAVHAGHEKEATPLVVDDGARPRVVERRVADIVPEEVRVEMLEQPHLTVASGGILDRDLLQIEVAVEVHGIAAPQPEAEAGVPQGDLADQRLVGIPDVALPPVVAGPAEQAVDPDTEAADVAHGVVLEADVGKVDVAKLVPGVEGDQEVTVPERKIARH